jgi:hypothetical protein
VNELDVVHHAKLVQQNGTHQAVKITARHQTILLLRHSFLPVNKIPFRQILRLSVAPVHQGDRLNSHAS